MAGTRRLLSRGPNIFYRIVKSAPPTLRDFTSKMELGLVGPHPDDYTAYLESGISTYRTLAQARRKARAFPSLGAFVVAIAIEDGAPIRWERTTRSAGHHTLWGEPAEIAARAGPPIPVRMVD